MNYEVVKSGTFLRWLSGFRDKRAQAQIILHHKRPHGGESCCAVETSRANSKT